ncbi:MAG: GNAT family N-acetyltransferase [Promethearchaeota archaeon]
MLSECRDYSEWREFFKNKEIKADDIINYIKPGNRIYIGSGYSEPTLLTKALVKHKEWNLYDVEIMNFFTTSEHKLYSELDPTKFRFNTLSIISSPQIRVAIKEGKCDFTPIKSSEIPKMLRGKRYKINVALLQVAPPDKNGYCSLGINVDINRTIVDVADTVIAQINPRVPRTFGNSFIKFEDIDYFVYGDVPLLEYKKPHINETTEKIARNVAKLIENGSTLNFGLGKIPYILPRFLSTKKNLAVYTEVLPETIMPLIKDRVINCAKNYYPHVMGTFAIGDHDFYDFINDNPFIELHPTDYLLNIENIAKNKKLCSIYSAKKVDLFGQGTNHIGKEFYSGIGGEADFLSGTGLYRRGKTIIAISSLTKEGESRIVPILPEGIVSVRAIDVHYVVTEWGIAHLHGKTMRERILQMIAIAHPDFRQELLDKAKEMNLVYKDQEIPMTKDGRVVIRPDFEWIFKTKNKDAVLVTPIKPSDERMIQDLYYSLSEKDRIMRFFIPKKIFTHEDTKMRVNCDYETCMVLVGIVGKEEEDQRIIAIAAYHLDPNTNWAEFSITIHDDYRNQGLGRFLLLKLAEIGESKGIKGIFGIVSSENIGMLNLLNTIPYRVVFQTYEEDPDYLEFYFRFKDKKNGT